MSFILLVCRGVAPVFLHTYEVLTVASSRETLRRGDHLVLGRSMGSATIEELTGGGDGQSVTYGLGCVCLSSEWYVRLWLQTDYQEPTVSLCIRRVTGFHRSNIPASWKASCTDSSFIMSVFELSNCRTGMHYSGGSAAHSASICF